MKSSLKSRKKKRRNLELPLCHVVVIWSVVVDELVDLDSGDELRKLFASVLHQVQRVFDKVVGAVLRAKEILDFETNWRILELLIAKKIKKIKINPGIRKRD